MIAELGPFLDWKQISLARTKLDRLAGEQKMQRYLTTAPDYNPSKNSWTITSTTNAPGIEKSEGISPTSGGRRG
jgi:hypothetical protein